MGKLKHGERKSFTPSHTISGSRAMIELRQTDTKPSSYPALICGAMSGEASSSSDTPTGLQGKEEIARSGEAKGRWEEKCGNRHTYEQTPSVKEEEQRGGKEVLKVRVPGVREEEWLKGGWARVWDYGGLYLLCARV